MLFTFPSRYWFTIGRQDVFSLRRWSSLIPTGFHVSRRTQDPLKRERSFNYRAVTFSGWPFQTYSSTPFLCNSMLSVLQPQEASLLVWAMSRFARRYSGNRVCFLFLRVLRCFSSPGVPPPALCIQARVPPHYGWRVSPFGNLRIKAYLQLPEAYRC